MIENYLYRIIKSQDTSYLLMPDKLVRLEHRSFSACGGSYETFTVGSGANSLSKAVVRKMFKNQRGKTRQWHYQFTNLNAGEERLAIGCQNFNATAVYALRKWLAQK